MTRKEEIQQAADVYMEHLYEKGYPTDKDGNFPTYEDAVEAALNYALTNLI